MVCGVEFIVIRHLPTIGNGKRQYIGWTDEPIVPTALEPYDTECTEVYGSDLLRTRQTAALLFPNATYQSDPRFRECNFGEFEGKTYTQLERYSHYRSWVEDPTALAPSGGESLRQVEARVVEAFQHLPPGARLVTHGGPIRLLLERFAPEPRDFWSWEVPHGVVYRFHWKTEGQWKEGQRCTSLSVERLTENGNSSGK
ncbi:histidine phosphatase family protein [Sporosarcina gallistercoris]|uniref:Histidine phosphatase family protein n=1 Tax=Sporosarcina gallistercoris TaxID=2762245 RepID=A0ABR8PM07_9BACL|nr:histidine phosphatase family protein [Sporosarcina gallistercoris]MBD7909207.1 histidine phosphatase family protein [Sporosarcina gallistercoris]